MSELTKNEEQIAKDKEAVKAMTGAKNNMEAALRRIERLENTLRSVAGQSKTLSEAFGKKAYLDVYQRDGTYKPARICDLFERIDNDIKAVL